MKVQHVNIGPSSSTLYDPTLSPGLLASVGARYSRNNEGLETILSQVDPNNERDSISRIFKMIDYGHQSIADMAPVAIFMDDISMWLAFDLWRISPTASGQESSTRYIHLNKNVLSSEFLSDYLNAKLKDFVDLAFESYNIAYEYWKTIAQNVLKKETIEPKVYNRLVRNYAFDRSRYWLPSCALTNVFMIDSGRGWMQKIRYLNSYPLAEYRKLGAYLLNILKKVLPELAKYGEYHEPEANQIYESFSKIKPVEKDFLRLHVNHQSTKEDFANNLTYHYNRYDPFGDVVKMSTVEYGWKAITFAEIRDLNRHRTGSKYLSFKPVGFYWAKDEVIGEVSSILKKNAEKMQTIIDSATSFDISRIGQYFLPFGTQFGFSRVTTADKFIYEVELRTGLGANFKYRQHYLDLLNLDTEDSKFLKPLINIGLGEPE